MPHSIFKIGLFSGKLTKQLQLMVNSISSENSLSICQFANNAIDSLGNESFISNFRKWFSHPSSGTTNFTVDNTVKNSCFMQTT